MIGPKSWFIFKHFGYENKWLNNSVSSWEDDEDFQKIRTIIVNCKVVNDAAERGVKLIQDFFHSITNDEEQRQYLLQVIEQNRSLIPNFKKETLKNALQ